MDNPQRVNLVDCLTNLLHDRCHFCLCNWLTLFELMLQLSSSANFQDDIDICFIVEKAVHFYDIWMAQKLLDFELSCKLLYNFFLFQKFLLHHLKRTHRSWIFLYVNSCTSWTKETWPYFPEPSYLIFLKSLMVKVLFFAKVFLFHISPFVLLASVFIDFSSSYFS